MCFWAIESCTAAKCYIETLLLCALIRHHCTTGLKLGIVSNFDTRLRPILKGLGLDQLFDTIVISAEIGVEKPNPIIFEAACQELGVLPEEAVHVGDDRRYSCSLLPLSLLLSVVALFHRRIVRHRVYMHCVFFTLLFAHQTSCLANSSHCLQFPLHQCSP